MCECTPIRSKESVFMWFYTNVYVFASTMNTPSPPPPPTTANHGGACGD